MTRDELLAELLAERYGVRPTPTPLHIALPQVTESVDELAAARRRRAGATTTDQGRTATA